MAPQSQTTPCGVLNVPHDKLNQLQALSWLSAETLTILADLSKKPGVEEKLKKNKILLQTLI